MDILRRLFERKQKTAKKMVSKGRPKINIDINEIMKLKRENKFNRKIARNLKVIESTIRKRLKDVEN